MLTPPCHSSCNFTGKAETEIKAECKDNNDNELTNEFASCLIDLEMCIPQRRKDLK